MLIQVIYATFTIKNTHDHKFFLIIALGLFSNIMSMEQKNYSGIKPFNPEQDLATVVELFKEEKKYLYPHLIQDQDIHSMIQRQFNAKNTLVCKNEHNQLIGFVHYTYQKPFVSCCGLCYRGASCSINYIAVKGPYRKKRYGTQLLAHLTNILFGHKTIGSLEHIDAFTHGDNLAASKLFEKTGFVAAKSRNQDQILD